MNNKLRRYLPALLVILAALVITAVTNRNNAAEANGTVELATAAAVVEFDPVSDEPAVISAVSDIKDPAVEGKKKEDKKNGSETTEAAESEKADDEDEAEDDETDDESGEDGTEDEIVVEKKGEYSDKDHVAAYIHEFGKLPSNYLTKKQAEKEGWDGKAKNLWKVAEGKSIGGNGFGNREGLLPEKKGRSYYECDIDFDGKERPDTRIVYSNDGLIYYTEDRFESFECLYDEDGRQEDGETSEKADEDDGIAVEKNGEYTDKEHVAAYLHKYGELPKNYITKKEAEELGWVSSQKNLWKVAPGMSIGGSYFGNYEGLLPEKKGRDYYECDIDYNGGGRNAKRIIYSNDGLIYYTDDHYESFTLLYGEE